MKKVIKKNNKPKALLGTAFIIGGLSALGSLIGSGISANAQRKAAERAQKQATFANNLENAMNFQTNDMQANNYNNVNELELLKTNSLNTIDSNQSEFLCGGKRKMKKLGGCVINNFHKLSRYI